MSSRPASPGALLVACALALSLTACSGAGAPAGTGPTASPAGRPSTPGAAATAAATAAPPFGPACPQVPAAGARTTVPVVSEAAGDPGLSTFVAAVQKADLVAALNGTADITVLAPTDTAFRAVPPATLSALLGNTPQLTAVLTHHVLPGRLTPAELAGRHTTIADDTVTIGGSGTTFTVSGDQTVSGRPAAVVCGGIQTANATVYVIDQVLQPAKKG